MQVNELENLLPLNIFYFNHIYWIQKDNTELAGEMFKRLSFSIVSNGTFSVDSFFLLSGLLTSFTFLKELSKRNSTLSFGFMFKYYVHRLWRLSPPYWAMLMFSLLLTKYLGSGPLYPLDGFENKDCQWWWNLLYLNNFLGFDKQVNIFCWIKNELILK